MKYVNIHKASGAEPGLCSASVTGIIMLLLCVSIAIFHLLLLRVGPFGQPLLSVPTLRPNSAPY